MSPATFDVSVVICAYTQDRWDDLVAAAAALQNQSMQARQIIVVVDHNPALLDRVCREIPNVTAMANQYGKGLSGARNSGAAIARGAVVAFLDDDALPEPDWVERLA